MFFLSLFFVTIVTIRVRKKTYVKRKKCAYSTFQRQEQSFVTKILLPAKLASVDVEGLDTFDATLPRLKLPLLREPRPALLPPI